MKAASQKRNWTAVDTFLTINLYFGTKSCKLSCYVSAKFEVERPYVQKEIHVSENNCIHYLALGHTKGLGAQWLSGRVLGSRPRGRGFEPHRRLCVVVLEQDTFILA